MKYLIMVVVFTTLITNSCLAKTIPPSAVTIAFKQKFPTATKVSWGKENTHEYEAEFTESGIAHSANFSDDGTWLETETVSDFNTFPVKVKIAFNTQHKGVKQREVTKIEKAKGILMYEIEIK